MRKLLDCHALHSSGIGHNPNVVSRDDNVDIQAHDGLDIGVDGKSTNQAIVRTCFSENTEKLLEDVRLSLCQGIQEFLSSHRSALALRKSLPGLRRRMIILSNPGANRIGALRGMPSPPCLSPSLEGLSLRLSCGASSNGSARSENPVDAHDAAAIMGALV